MRNISIVRTAELRSVIDETRVIDAVRHALIDFAEGRTDAPPPGLLLSNDPPGDCHVKFARSASHDLMIVKTATGFYRNGSLNLPVNDGLVNVFSASTGQLCCVIDDGGLLTAMRTAAAGLIAARLGWDDKSKTVGIIGTGHQAEFQAAWAARHLSIRPVQLFGRSLKKATELAERLAVRGLKSVVHCSTESLTSAADTIITCTSSSSPVIESQHLRPGHHIVSLGADGPGKCEIADNVYGIADAIAVDDLSQAMKRDDFASAVDRKLLLPARARPMGELLAAHRSMRNCHRDITLINLCGTAACDLAVTDYLLSLHPNGGHPREEAFTGVPT